jgi:hypothetical protein
MGACVSMAACVSGPQPGAEAPPPPPPPPLEPAVPEPAAVPLDEDH